MSNPLYDALFAPLIARDSVVLHLGDGTALTGRDFSRLICRTAHVFKSMGLQKGVRIAVQCAKSPEALATYAACVGLGAIFLPLNPAYTAEEIDYFIGNATPAIFLCDPGKAAALAPIALKHGAALLTLGPDGQGSLTDAALHQPATLTPVDCSPDDLAAILYTSGTTGRSKGAMLSHGNLLSNAQTLAELWRFTDADTLLHTLPIFHTHGLFVATNTLLLAQGSMIFLSGFDAKETLHHLPRATTLMGVPTFYTRLLDTPGFDRAATAHMRLFISGSAPLLAETHLEFEARTGHRILERYGMTETNMNTSNPYDGLRRAGTVGLPLPGVEMRLMSGDSLADEVGMIEVRGPNVFRGYWQMPEKTAEDLRPDGWFKTGDLGTCDADGYYSIVGRAKDLIITGGYNVYPKEIELLLDEAPGILESAVIGLPHPDFGEAVFAVLVARNGQTPTPQATLATLQNRLARYKQPKAAIFLPELPRNTMGKVQKNLLRQNFAEWFTKPASQLGLTAQEMP